MTRQQVSPGYDQTRSAELADAARAHCGIEHRLHWSRDITFAEDLSQIRTGHGPLSWPPCANGARVRV